MWVVSVPDYGELILNRRQNYEKINSKTGFRPRLRGTNLKQVNYENCITF